MENNSLPASESQCSEKWFEVKEKSRTGFGLKMMFFLLKFTPAFFMRLAAFPVGFFYWIFSRKARMYSRQFLDRQKEYSCSKKNYSTLRHIVCFALNMVENIQSWGGKFSFKNVTWQNDDVQDLVANINKGHGTICLINHIGNAQMLKGLAASEQAGVERKMSITTIMDVKNGAGFFNLLKSINSNVEFHIIPSDDIGPDTIMVLQDRLDKGEMVVIAGDRISANSDRTVEHEFLGKSAKFPYGVFLLTALLNVPVYHICGLRHNDLSLTGKYDMFVTKLKIDFNCGRKERENRISEAVGEYVQELERFSSIHPCQWYHFYDFWG